jgi:hypothetical protein
LSTYVYGLAAAHTQVEYGAACHGAVVAARRSAACIPTCVHGLAAAPTEVGCIAACGRGVVATRRAAACTTTSCLATNLLGLSTDLRRSGCTPA